MIFYTADLHLGFPRILKACVRPFASVEEMDEVLIRNWNETVGDQDTVYIVGDFAEHNGKAPMQYLKRLHGHKHFLFGNHDAGMADRERLLDCCESVSDLLEIEDGGEHILLCHYPIIHERSGWMIHGHTHNRKDHSYQLLKELPKVLNAGVDINGFRPVTLTQLIENNLRFYSEE